MISKHCLLIIVIAFFAISKISAQSVILPAGNSTSTNAGTLSYSIGQTFYSAYSNTKGAVQEGVQQPISKSSLISSIDSKLSLIDITISPNPVNSTLNIKMANYLPNCNWTIHDINGRLIDSAPILDAKTNIDTDNLPTGPFIITVQKANQSICKERFIKK